MSESELQKWKEKCRFLQKQAVQKDRIIKEYKTAVEQSSQTIQEVMTQLSLELKLAHQMHRMLLPVKMPVIPGCEFSYKFRPAGVKQKGKDFYQIIPYSRSKFGLMMSSCFSHSLSAVLFSARLKVFSQGQKTPSPPGQFISHLRREIKNDRKHSSKETPAEFDLFYCLVDQKTYQMSYCLTGQITALLWCAQKKEITLLPPAEEPSQQKFFLNGQDRLLVCSPGILSSQNPAGESCPLSFLKKLIQNHSNAPVDELRNRLLFELDHFCAGRPSLRDQSVLVMGVKTGLLKLA